MQRSTLVLALALAATTFLLLRHRLKPDREPQHNPKDIARVEPSPVCPWRNPAQDLAMLFPPATNHVTDPRVVSGLTAQIQKQLGRLMHPDENPLLIHRAQHDGRTIGSVLVTRVKAEYGGIEIVLGVETNGAIRGVLIQSQRETPEIAEAITNAAWLGSFTGKNAHSPLQPGTDLLAVPEAARLSAQAIARGVRDTLTVLAFAELSREARELGQLPHH
jgi:hypothetical protein